MRKDTLGGSSSDMASHSTLGEVARGNRHDTFLLEEQLKPIRIIKTILMITSESVSISMFSYTPRGARKKKSLKDILK